MAKVTVEIDTETKAVSVNMNGLVLSDVRCFSVYKYSDCCEICVEEQIKQDGMTVYKRYSACASQNQPIEISEANTDEKIKKLSDYFKK